MAIVRWEPFDEFDRFFNNRLPSLISNVSPFGWDMAADVYEDNDAVVAEMSLPGMKGDEITVKVKDGYLYVSGSREEKQEKKEKHHYMQEIRTGTFERAIRLPVSVKKEAVQAEYKNGVLRVVMPKNEGKDDAVKVEVKE